MELALSFIGVAGIIGFIVWLLFFRKSAVQQSRSATPPRDPRIRQAPDYVPPRAYVAPMPSGSASDYLYPVPTPHRVGLARPYSPPLRSRRYFRHDGETYYQANGVYYYPDGRALTNGLLLAGVATAALVGANYIANAEEVERIARYHDSDPNVFDGWTQGDYAAEVGNHTDGLVTGPGSRTVVFDDPVMSSSDAIRHFGNGSDRPVDAEPIVTPLPTAYDWPPAADQVQRFAEAPVAADAIQQFADAPIDQPAVRQFDEAANDGGGLSRFDRSADAGSGMARFTRDEPAEEPAVRRFAEAVEVIPDEPDVQEVEEREEPEAEDRDDD